MKPREIYDADKLWSLTGEVNEYFRKLGGSGCYPGFADWHVLGLVLLLVSGLDPSEADFFDSRESHTLPLGLWRETDGLPISIAEKLKGTVITQKAFEESLKRSFAHLSTTAGAGDLLDWAKFLDRNSSRFVHLR